MHVPLITSAVTRGLFAYARVKGEINHFVLCKYIDVFILIHLFYWVWNHRGIQLGPGWGWAKNPTRYFSCPSCQLRGVSFERLPRPWQTVGPISSPFNECWQLLEPLTQCADDTGMVRIGRQATRCLPSASPCLRWPDIVARHPTHRASHPATWGRNSVARSSRSYSATSFACITASQEVTASHASTSLHCFYVNPENFRRCYCGPGWYWDTLHQRL